MRRTDVYDHRGRLLATALGVDPDAWDQLYPNWQIAIEFERVVTDTTTTRIEGHDIVAIVERGNPTRYLR
jgi:hypothetical protein